MAVLGSIIDLVLWFCILLLLTRLVVDWIQMFARSWVPRGPAVVALEVVYSFTDPPIRLVRRFVPPLRLGGMTLDFTILLVLLMFYVLRILNGRLLPIA